MTRRMKSRRIGCVSGSSGPAIASVRVTPVVIPAARSANNVASRRRAPPRSVPARTMPARDDADGDLADAGHRQHEDVSVHATGGAELIAGDDRGGVAGQGRGIGGKVTQHVAPKAHAPPHSARPIRNGTRSSGKHTASRTITTAPTTVPIMRNQPLRSEAPSCGWQTSAADVPAQYALSSSSQNATYSARADRSPEPQAECQGRTPGDQPVRKPCPRSGDRPLCPFESSSPLDSCFQAAAVAT